MDFYSMFVLSLIGTSCEGQTIVPQKFIKYKMTSSITSFWEIIFIYTKSFFKSKAPKIKLLK